MASLFTGFPENNILKTNKMLNMQGITRPLASPALKPEGVRK